MAVKPTSRAKPVFKAVLLISVDKTQPEKLRKLATRLRCLPGVRHIEAVVFQGWRAEPPRDVPWRPHGALIHVESADEGTLREKVIPQIWREALKASKTDPEGMELGCIDMW